MRRSPSLDYEPLSPLSSLMAFCTRSDRAWEEEEEDEEQKLEIMVLELPTRRDKGEAAIPLGN